VILNRNIYIIYWNRWIRRSPGMGTRKQGRKVHWKVGVKWSYHWE